ncbi:unnamed protein product [Spirodela intermedia]|uniref:Histidine-containing phosphotransfer protein n=1 Tax=Spirodela intermedia TaxID=51605 RepID=A0A7I8IXS7_SPIIN|nr:unnamed protein product [Spirodela intermedia]CAA6662502.1 unnamed protein product [Spirodela intermedia]
MECSPLYRQAANMKKSLLDQGYLDEQFHQLEELQDDLSPNFVEEVKTPRDFQRLDGFIHQLKGSSSSIGAAKVKNECSAFQDHCNQGSTEGCLRSFKRVKREHAALRQKLENYLQVLRQVSPSP